MKTIKGAVEATFRPPHLSVVAISRSTCASCTGPVHRSWRTGILHTYCYACRYLRMIYGNSITVRRIK
jgi:hypothetical protein